MSQAQIFDFNNVVFVVCRGRILMLTLKDEDNLCINVFKREQNNDYIIGGYDGREKLRT